MINHDQYITYVQTHTNTGASEMLMANAVQELAAHTPGKESMAMEAFARALRQLPIIIADNAGYDSSELISQLRALHSEGKTTMGLGERGAGHPDEYMHVVYNG